jgi:hypothetical protein
VKKGSGHKGAEMALRRAGRFFDAAHTGAQREHTARQRLV